MLQERGRLPKYGDCWQAAVEHVHEGCRFLSEETQSDIALHITNCFLAMSGHDQYNCELDKKPNLRGICISSMSDRAFNVYTEFYTHTQNICWFLRGQVWQEKITESTIKVGEKLQGSLKQQRELLDQQRKSLELQEKLLSYGQQLEHALNESRVQAAHVLDEIREGTIRHQQLLIALTDSLGALRSWIVGEISWFDTLLHYIGCVLVTIAVTSIARTSSARLPLLFTLSFNVVLERTICNLLTDDTINNPQLLQDNIQFYVWWCRRITIFICMFILVILAYTYRDLVAINNTILLDIQKQNILIKAALAEKERTPARSSISIERTCNGVDSTTSSVRQNSLTPNTIKYNLRSRLTPLRYTKITDLNGHV